MRGSTSGRAGIGPLQVDADRRGYVVATAATARRALELADAAARKLHVEVEPAARVLRLPRRRAVGLSVGAVAVLAAGALAWSQTTSRPMIADHVTRTLLPLCGCPGDVAHIAFRLLRRSELGVTILNGSGGTVARILTPGERPARMIHLV